MPPSACNVQDALADALASAVTLLGTDRRLTLAPGALEELASQQPPPPSVAEMLELPRCDPREVVADLAEELERLRLLGLDIRTETIQQLYAATSADILEQVNAIKATQVAREQAERDMELVRQESAAEHAQELERFQRRLAEQQQQAAAQLAEQQEQGGARELELRQRLEEEREARRADQADREAALEAVAKAALCSVRAEVAALEQRLVAANGQASTALEEERRKLESRLDEVRSAFEEQLAAQRREAEEERNAAEEAHKKELEAACQETAPADASTAPGKGKPWIEVEVAILEMYLDKPSYCRVPLSRLAEMIWMSGKLNKFRDLKHIENKLYSIVNIRKAPARARWRRRSMAPRLRHTRHTQRSALRRWWVVCRCSRRLRRCRRAATSCRPRFWTQSTWLSRSSTRSSSTTSRSTRSR